ncbi:hypothetical protein ELQ92_13340 [Labedella populi]|uniref:Ig-like domain-containing protein n=1 Tax=Labedella populi TaxID=2498850 RepID=A0A3S4AGF5_9MICO|nr:hypothetical protein [Labedella populi]RWZ59241.1 hypothetical protein ELQ92_13340 [Labedella populi]
MSKRAVMAAVVLAAGIALAGCTSGSPEPSSSPSAGGSTPTRPTPTATAPTPSVTATPAPTPTPTSPASWTAESAYAACVAFHRDKTAADGLDPDSASWNPYSPDVVRQNGSEWLVDLIGTVEDDDGNVYDGIFSCTVGGTPAAPSVSESAGM